MFLGKVLKPIKTDMQPTLESVLKSSQNQRKPTKISNKICKCKSISKNVCRTNLCSCRKHGLKCMVARGKCRGESCGNSMDYIGEDHHEDMFERNLFDLFD